MTELTTNNKNKNSKKPSKERCKKTTVTRQVRAGTKEMIDAKTGEPKIVPNFEIRDVDFNFNKIWLGHLLDCLDVIGNKKITIMTWLLDNRGEKDNVIHATQRMIATETGVSLPTVTETLMLMQKQNVLIKKRNGVYQINPDMVFIGDSTDRMDILLTYKKTKTIEAKKLEDKKSDSNE